MTQLEKVNNCARVLYAEQDCIVEDGYDFSVATHPQEKLMFNMAIVSKEFWRDE